MDFNNLNLEELNNLSKEEKDAVLKILKEYSLDGNSKYLNELRYADYKEIPVDIETFLHNPRYLGSGLTDDEGRFTVFPYWVNMLKKIFPNNLDTTYNTLVLSGAIGLGKSFIAVICLLYMLYRMLCLKDPYKHYGLQPIDLITFSFINITKDAAKGVAWNKCQQLVQLSPWFMENGTVNKADMPEWQPNGGIELIYGSLPRHIIGRAIYCLDGDTLIMTSKGEHKIKDLVNKDIEVYSINDEGELIISDTCTVEPTLVSNEEYEIELEDGTTIKCTPNHRFMLKDGTYKEAQFLTEDDELFDYNISYDEFIQNIIKTRGQWNIPENEYYEVHHIIPKCLGGEGTIKKGRKNNQHQNLIYLYPQEHFIAHKLLALEHPENKSLVYAWSMMAFPKGKTERDFPITPEEYANLRKLQSNVCKTNNNFLKEGKPWNKGLTKETDERVRLQGENSKGLNTWTKGSKRSQETRKKMSEAVKKRYKEHPETFGCGNRGKLSINNGVECRYINKDEQLPEGYTYGQGKHKSYIIKDREEFCKRTSEQSKGKNNPMYNKGYKISGGKNGKAIYIYTYLGVDYQCRDDLMKVLKIDYPDISESTIRRIMNGKYTTRITSKYQYVIDNLSWRLKDKYKDTI